MSRALALPRGARHVLQMHVGRGRRGPKRAAAHANHFDWTAITIVVSIAVAVAVGAFYWFTF